MNNNSLDKKIKKAAALIKNSLKKHENPVVACSFGKDSMVVLHMVRQFESDIPVMFNNTLVEYPDTYRFKNLMSKEWNLNIIETKPSKTFWWIVENYGFPLFTRKGHKDASKNCCRYLKEYPIAKILRKYKFDLYFTGLSRHESRLREFSAKRYGNYFYSKTQKHWKCHPIQDWTEEDVWNYHNLYHIPHNGVYDKKSPDGFILRTGCWCCTIPIKYGKTKFLRMNYPSLWRILMTKGLGNFIVEKKIGMSIPEPQLEHMIQNRPCFFDKY
ncbi:MAG: phosphoadenosine phosphosulfate reductase family protein [Candidatus Aminicenantes bacterium]|nr:MAG: phosphoadenosine phosphosulfate reductase family protein [Candidatus Aminicenantes bacterium]